MKQQLLILIAVSALTGSPSLALSQIPLKGHPAIAPLLEGQEGAPQSSLEDRIATLEATLAEAQNAIQTLQSQIDELHHTDTSGEPQEERLPSLATVIRLEHKPLNGLKGPHLIFEGVNVHIRSGSGASYDRNVSTGLGNLIIGYNEQPTDLEPHDRNGAHNLIIGGQHKFRSTEGFVAGFNNTLSSPSSSICGGFENETNGLFATIGGGVNNEASGLFSYVSGGLGNTASSNSSSVSGGSGNTASGTRASVSGGRLNTASGEGASISGGRLNTASGRWASIAGGVRGTVSGDEASISAGIRNIATGPGASVSGGQFNIASGEAASVSGGVNNEASSSWASVSHANTDDSGQPSDSSEE